MTTAAAPPGVPTKDSYDPLASAPPAAPPKSGGMGARFANAFRRQTAEEKEAKRRDKEKRMREEMSKHESKSSRMDVIDRLDSTGLYGASRECSEHDCLVSRLVNFDLQVASQLIPMLVGVACSVSP